ncbi:MAG: PP0621 family protein [Betaproteobacteria bacterium]
MGKALFWVVAFLGGLLATRVLAQVAAKKMYNDSLPKQGGTQRTVEAEAMVRCAHCGVHLPESEAINKAGVSFCSQAHASLGAKSPR